MIKDEDGDELHRFLASYKMDDTIIDFYIMARNFDEAEKVLEAIKETGVLDGVAIADL